MQKIKQRTFSGVVCEQEVFTMKGMLRISTAHPRERFKDEQERIQHRLMMSKRHHARIVNANFSPTSLYSTLTLDDEHEVHTFDDARRIRDLFVRRIRRAQPDAKLTIYMGRGKSTNRIHLHMISDGISQELICQKWQAGSIVRIEHLRTHNLYDGVDHGQDYTALANYLFNHWTPEQGGHRWKATKNIAQPTREKPTAVRRAYSLDKPPLSPKGYTLVESYKTNYGYFYYKYVRLTD